MSAFTVAMIGAGCGVLGVFAGERLERRRARKRDRMDRLNRNMLDALRRWQE